MEIYIHPDILTIKTEILDWEEKLIHELEITIKQNERMQKCKDVEESFKQKIQSLSYDLKILIVQITTKLVSFREDIQLYTRKEIEEKKKELYEEYQVCLKKLKNLQLSTQKFKDLEKTQKPTFKKKQSYEEALQKIEQKKNDKERKRSKECNLYKIYDQQEPIKKPPSPSFNKHRNRSNSPHKLSKDIQELKNQAQQVKQTSQNHLHGSYEEEISKLQQENKALKDKINILYEEHSHLKNNIDFIKQKCDYLENENANLYDLIQNYLQTQEQISLEKSNPTSFRTQISTQNQEKTQQRGMAVQEVKNQKSEKPSTPKQRYLIPQNRSFDSDQNQLSDKNKYQDIINNPIVQKNKYIIPKPTSSEKEQGSDYEYTPKKSQPSQENSIEQNYNKQLKYLIPKPASSNKDQTSDQEYTPEKISTSQEKKIEKSNSFSSIKRKEIHNRNDSQSSGNERFLLPQKKIDATQLFQIQRILKLGKR